MPGDAATVAGPPEVPYSASTFSFCRSIPKVELHAHLNGSIRNSTIKELVHEHHINTLKPHEIEKVLTTNERTLSDCFKLFDIIHQITTSHDVITRLTREVIEDFAAENVMYIELRTTPKHRPEHGMTKRTYVQSVLDGMKQYQQGSSAGIDIQVRLLLSIDRRESTEAALETVALAEELVPDGVVGIDLSGNPWTGQWQTWLPALQRARSVGLRLTLHAAEVENPVETHAMLDFAPDRLGHMCRLDQALEAKMLGSNIPVELCLTSNVMTDSVPGYGDHHFLQLFRAGHPVVLCTDDSGVFATSLSKEYAIAATVFKLTESELVELCSKSIDYCFVGAEEKARMQRRLADFRAQL